MSLPMSRDKSRHENCDESPHESRDENPHGNRDENPHENPDENLHESRDDNSHENSDRVGDRVSSPATPGREMRNLRDVILTGMTGFLPRQHKARIHLFGDGTSARMLPGCGVRTNRDVSGEFAGRIHGPMV
jgi:hypothetical protein